MPTIADRLTDHGAIVSLLVGVSDAGLAMLQKHNLPVPPRVMLPAQIDTGACQTAVAGDIFGVGALQLGPTGKQEVRTTSASDGTSIFDLYAVSLGFDNLGDQKIVVPALEVLSCFFMEDEGIRALIGRDLLSHCHYFHEGPAGAFSLSY